MESRPHSSGVAVTLMLPYWIVGRVISISAILVGYLDLVAVGATPVLGVLIVVHLTVVVALGDLGVLVVPVVVVRTGAHRLHSDRSTSLAWSCPCWPGSSLP